MLLILPMANIYIDEMVYGDIDTIDSHILSYSFFGVDVLKHITEHKSLFLEKIRQGFYIVVFLDEYFIEGTYSYKKFHYRHEFLLYGFDIACQ